MTDVDAMLDGAPEAPKIDVDLDGTIRDMTVEQLVMEYRDVRAALDERSKEFKKYKEDAELAMNKLGARIQEIAESLGVTSLRTPAGTAYRNLKEHYRVGDWDSALAWMVRTHNLHCLEKRVGKLAVQEIHRSTGELPPGITYFSEIEFVVRRS